MWIKWNLDEMIRQAASAEGLFYEALIVKVHPLFFTIRRKLSFDFRAHCSTGKYEINLGEALRSNRAPFTRDRFC